MANITSAGTGNSNAGATWTGGSVPTSSDRAIIQNGHTVTQNAAHTFKSLKVESGGAWTADGSNHLTLSGEDDNDFAFRILGTYNHANGTVVINNGGGGIAHAAIEAGVATSTTGLYDLTISGGGTTCEIFGDTTIHRNMEAGGSTTVLRGALTVNGSLTVEGTLNTRYSSTDRNLTVAGALTNNGTLTLNGSTVNLGSTSAEAGDVTGTGTFNLDTSTINFHTAGGANFIPSTSANFDTNTSTLNLIGLNGSNRAHNFNFASGNMHNITTSRGAGTDTHTETLNGNCTITGDLTVGANSIFDTGSDRDLTVTGATSITGTLTCNASTVELGSGKTDAFAVVVNDSGTFNGGSGTHTYGSLNVNSSAALFAFSSGTTTLDGKSNTSRIFSTSATNRITAAGTLNIATSQTPVEIRCDDDTAINNLTMNSSSKILHLINFRGSGNSNPLVIGGNLTITAGTVSTRNVDDTTDFGLTVAGGIKNTGTLTANASTILITGELAGFALNQMGTFNAGTSTIQIGDGSTSTVGSNGTNFKTNNCHNLIINQHLDAPNGDVQWRAYTGTEITIGGNLTVTKGKFRPSVSTQDLTVTGNVDIAANGQIGTGAESGAMSFGTLTIASGGTYLATSGTTTITQANGAPVNGRCWYIPNSATFTHNNGLCKFTASNPQVEMVSSGQTSTPNPFYDVEQTAGTMQWKGEHTKVLNNATLRGSQFNGSTGNLTVLGICRFTASSFNASDTSTSNHNFFGTLVIESGATVDVSAIDITVGSLRNLGGTIQ